MPIKHDWTVLLIGGASGSGKSCLSYRLAQIYGVSVLEIDDFQTMLEAMTSPAVLPALHYWNTHPGWQAEGASATVGQLIDVANELANGLAAVVESHLETSTPVIIEGDFLLPKLASTLYGSAVKALFVHEEDKEQIAANYHRREPAANDQQHRAEVSWLYGNWLSQQCTALALPLLAARPWDTSAKRAMTLISL